MTRLAALALLLAAPAYAGGIVDAETPGPSAEQAADAAWLTALQASRQLGLLPEPVWDVRDLYTVQPQVDVQPIEIVTRDWAYVAVPVVLGAAACIAWCGESKASTPTALPGEPVAVPEPGAWLLMLLGFGAVGAAVRNRRRVYG